MRLSPALALALIGCTPSSSLFEGPAAWVVSLSATSSPSLPPAQFGTALAIVTTIEGGSDLEEDSWVTDAQVTVSTGAGEVSLVHQDDGLYLADPLAQAALFASADTMVRADIDLADGPQWIEQRAIEAVVPPGGMLHDPSEPLEIDLPKGTDREHTGLVIQVYDSSGDELLWQDFPETSKEWLDLVGKDRVPKTVTIPARAFETDDDVVAVAIYALRQDDESFARSKGLRSELSGFLTGSALLVPIVLVR